MLDDPSSSGSRPTAPFAESSPHGTEGRLSRLLWAAGLTSLLVLACLVGLQYALFRSPADGLGRATQTVDVAGRQRLLAARVADLARHLPGSSFEEAVELCASLERTAVAMEASHTVLSHGDATTDLPPPEDPAIRALLFDPSTGLDERMEEFLDDVRLLARTWPADDLEHLSEDVYSSAISIGPLLEAFVQAHDDHNRKRSHGLKRLQRLGLGAQLATLVAIGLFLFRPMIRRIRQELAERLRQGRLFRELVESAPNAVILIDEGGRIVLANAEAERLFGHAREELLGREIECLVPPRFRTDHPENRRSFFAQPSRRPMGAGGHLHGLRKDGSEFPVEIGLNPLHTPEGTFVLSSIVDVTERREDEERLRLSAEELRRSNKELEQFAYVASHDLQEPLRMVASYLQLLEQRIGDGLGEEERTFMAFAVDGAHRMQTLIGDLLTLSRVGRRGTAAETVDGASVLEEVLEDLQAQAEESGAVVTHGDLPRLRADRAQIRQLLENLISNAIKFRGEAPPRVRVEGRRQTGRVELEVHDNGIGVEPRHAERVFGVFQRLHGRDRYPGTGIGLAICRKIVEHHGGRIWVEPNPEGGSTFRVTLPD